MYPVSFQRYTHDGGDTKNNGEEGHELTEGTGKVSVGPHAISHEEETGNTVDDHQKVGQGEVDNKYITRPSHTPVTFKSNWSTSNFIDLWIYPEQCR